MGMLKEKTDGLGKQFSIDAVNTYTVSQTSYSNTVTRQLAGGAVYTQINGQNQTINEVAEYGALNQEETFF